MVSRLAAISLLLGCVPLQPGAGTYALTRIARDTPEEHALRLVLLSDLVPNAAADGCSQKDGYVFAGCLIEATGRSTRIAWRHTAAGTIDVGAACAENHRESYEFRPAGDRANHYEEIFGEPDARGEITISAGHGRRDLDLSGAEDRALCR